MTQAWQELLGQWHRQGTSQLELGRAGGWVREPQRIGQQQCGPCSGVLSGVLSLRTISTAELERVVPHFLESLVWSRSHQPQSRDVRAKEVFIASSN